MTPDRLRRVEALYHEIVALTAPVRAATLTVILNWTETLKKAVCAAAPRRSRSRLELFFLDPDGRLAVVLSLYGRQHKQPEHRARS